jgi:predicted enzyme related to lactoylglutathione lyase
MGFTVARAEMYWPPITDSPTGVTHPGRWVWAELLTRDVGIAAEFYGKVFGWTFETYGTDDDLRTYTLVLADGVPIGGMVFANPRDRSVKPDARWVGLVSVPDVEAVAGRVASGGGKVVMPARVLGQRGTAALFTDPEGAIFGAITSATGDPEDYLGEMNQWLWMELWADDVARVAEFYKASIGYEVVGGAVPSESTGVQTGVHLVSGGLARAGILAKPAKVQTAWLPYVRVQSVADAVARARAGGGRIVLEPTRAHGTNVALIQDPTGAPVAVAEWTPKDRAQP